MIFTRSKPKLDNLRLTPHVLRTYFDASWELWKREVSQYLWDWAVDGPFCKDSQCSQRLIPSRTKKHAWTCVRCGRRALMPRIDLYTLRNLVVQSFEEEDRTSFAQ